MTTSSTCSGFCTGIQGEQGTQWLCTCALIVQCLRREIQKQHRRNHRSWMLLWQTIHPKEPKMHILGSVQKPRRSWNVKGQGYVQMKHSPKMILCVPGENMEGCPLRWGNTEILGKVSNSGWSNSAVCWSTWKTTSCEQYKQVTPSTIWWT